MINIFTKASIVKSLDYKISTKEIKSYTLTKTALNIKKSKRCNHTIYLDSLPPHILIRLLNKKIPDSGIINISDFFKREIRQLKLSDLI
jgi:hypothetical protein